MLHDAITPRPHGSFFAPVDGALLVVGRITQRTAGKGTRGATNQRAAERVTTAAIVADDRTSQGAKRTAGHSAVLSIRTGANAPTQQCAKREGRSEKNFL